MAEEEIEFRMIDCWLDGKGRIRPVLEFILEREVMLKDDESSEEEYHGV